jgi:hypothetical protein
VQVAFNPRNMVRSIIIVLIACGCFVFVGAREKTSGNTVPVKKTCSGYSVIEVDKGIDCNGDTIKLVKVNGFFQRATLAAR